MPLVTFEAPPWATDRGETASIQADFGRLLDACDEARPRLTGRAPVGFSCRSARCGACRIEVLDGAGSLEEPGREESEWLAARGEDRAARLACQVVLRADGGHVRLRWIGSPDLPDSA